MYKVRMCIFFSFTIFIVHFLVHVAGFLVMVMPVSAEMVYVQVNGLSVVLYCYDSDLSVIRIC